MADAEAALKELMVDKVHGDAGNEVVLEEFIEGEEISIHALCDGINFKLFPASQDHKRTLDGDKGKNTGGMGAIAPVPWMTVEMMTAIELHIIHPMVEALAFRGTPFVGMLYAGIKIGNGEPKVLEWNARFGDPETQAYMPILKTDLFDLIEACLNGTIADTKIEWRYEAAASVVLASAGYPDDFQEGFPIYGINDAERNDNVVVFQAGTTFDGLQTKTAGGRVLSVTAVGSPLQRALDLAYEAIKKIDFKGMQYRHDIGARSLK